MSSGTYNITLEQGADFYLSMQLTDENDAVIDLTGYTARLQIRQYSFSPTPAITATTENGKITIVPISGTIVVRISNTETTTLNFRRGLYDLEIVDSLGEVTRLLQGTVINSVEVTK